MYSRIASHMQRTLFSTRSLICSSRILRGGCESSSPSVIRSRHYALAADPKSTVDVDEISHFSRLSSLWWDEHGECAQLHRMNPVRMQFIREKVAEITLEDDLDASVDPPRILQGLDVLDVGCGAGLLCESLARLGANIIGIDASSSNIQIASLHAASDPALGMTAGTSSKSAGRLSYRHTTVEDLLAERGPASFDVVCSMEVIEHVNNPRDFLSSCAQLVKPGGHLFLSTISRSALGYFLTIFLAEDALSLVQRGTHTFSKFVRPNELEDFFRQYRSPSANNSLSKPWISSTTTGRPNRLEAETRGMVFVPWQGGWHLGPRFAGWAEGANYCFWVRRPAH